MPNEASIAAVLSKPRHDGAFNGGSDRAKPSRRRCGVWPGRRRELGGVSRGVAILSGSRHDRSRRWHRAHRFASPSGHSRKGAKSEATVRRGSGHWDTGYRDIGRWGRKLLARSLGSMPAVGRRRKRGSAAGPNNGSMPPSTGPSTWTKTTRSPKSRMWTKSLSCSMSLNCRNPNHKSRYRRRNSMPPACSMMTACLTTKTKQASGAVRPWKRLRSHFRSCQSR